MKEEKDEGFTILSSWIIIGFASDRGLFALGGYYITGIEFSTICIRSIVIPLAQQHSNRIPFPHRHVKYHVMLLSAIALLLLCSALLTRGARKQRTSLHSTQESIA